VTPAFKVEAPGLLTTVQDLGRPNAIGAGVQEGGAMDRFAHSAANLLVGNDPGLATLECTLRGPALVAEQACLVAITGADLDPRVNGVPAPMWTSLLLSPGDRLTFGGRREGARTYVAVAGGFEAGSERELGPDLVLALDHQRVGEVDAAGPHPDARLIGPQLRAADLVEAEPIGAAPFAA
jgi:hypothetical protein